MLARSGQRAAVITFDPHPMCVLRPDRAPLMIQTLSQRLAGFEQMGLDAALVLRFDRALSLVSAEEFIERILVGGLRAGAILVGDNFRFGHRGAGDVRLLGEFGKRDGFDVEIVPPVEVGGQIVSSTAIRGAVASGDVAAAIPLLGRAFSLTGEIRAGAGRGRTILFPTLNWRPNRNCCRSSACMRPNRVVGGKLYSSVTNVGTRPTFNGAGVTVESHLFGFNENVSGGADGSSLPREDSRRAEVFRGGRAARADCARYRDGAEILFGTDFGGKFLAELTVLFWECEIQI